MLYCSVLWNKSVNQFVNSDIQASINSYSPQNIFFSFHLIQKLTSTLFFLILVYKLHLKVSALIQFQAISKTACTQYIDTYILKKERKNFKTITTDIVLFMYTLCKGSIKTNKHFSRLDYMYVMLMMMMIVVKRRVV